MLKGFHILREILVDFFDFPRNWPETWSETPY